jgi:hypothetical protein
MDPKYVLFTTVILSIDKSSCQDLYPKYLETSKGFSNHDATIATIIGTCVSISGYLLVALNLIHFEGCHLVSNVFATVTKAYSFSEAAH